MADRTLTVNGQPFTFNRDRFAGVRTMTVSEPPLSDTTVRLQITYSGHADMSGVYERTSTSSNQYNQVGGHGYLEINAIADGAVEWGLVDGSDNNPNTIVIVNGITNTLPWQGLSEFAANGITLAPVSETVTVNRTAPVITSDRKGESRPLLSKLVGGAAAAYSLRDLNDKAGNNKVVRVRRASDNAERDFLAKEVSNDTLKNWVNTQTVLPLDLQALTADGRTGSVIGASAAYSLRNLSKNYTGNVVDVRRSSDDTPQSFTAAQVADGTLLAFVNVGDQHKGSSFFANSAASRVTLGSNIALTATNNWSLKFKVIMGETSSAGYGIFKNTATGNNGSLFLPPARNQFSFTDDSGNSSSITVAPSLGGTAIGEGEPTEIELINTAGSGVSVKIDGVTRTGQISIGNLEFNAFGNGRGRAGERVIFDVEIDLTGDGTVDHKYAGDGATNSNWVDQAGSNDGTILNASFITAYNNEFTDGHVSKWYDQSGNTNHVTQDTPANQPKIVEAGSLLTAGVTFDEANETEMATASAPVITAGSTGTFSAFSVQTIDNAEAGYLYGSASTSNGTMLYARQTTFTLSDRTAISAKDRIGKNSSQNVMSAIFNNADVAFSVNGSTSMTQGTGSFVFSAPTSPFKIGNRHGGTSAGTFLNGSIKEIIIYNDDQSANRTAIEANIGEHYSITGIPAYDNTVDGFVEAWYDQSGNGNDVTQPTSGNQPKIVDGGSLVKDTKDNPAIDWDNVDDKMLLDEKLITGGEYSIFTYTEFNAPTMFLKSNINAPAFRAVSNTAFTVTSYSPVVTATFQVASTKGLISFVKDSNHNGRLHRNGTESSSGQRLVGGGSGSSNSNYTTFGSEAGGAAGDGKLVEFIYYASDQSANRPAIEANINNQYDIY